MQYNAVLTGRVRHLRDIGQPQLLGRQEDSPLQHETSDALVCMRKHHSTFRARLVRNAAPLSRFQDRYGLGPAVVATKRLEWLRQDGDTLRHQEPQMLRPWALISCDPGALQTIVFVVQPARAVVAE